MWCGVAVLSRLPRGVSAGCVRSAGDYVHSFIFESVLRFENPPVRGLAEKYINFSIAYATVQVARNPPAHGPSSPRVRAIMGEKPVRPARSRPEESP